MLSPPAAILVDLDDTIISAYGQPLRLWTRVTQEFSNLLEPRDTLEIAYSINAEAEEFWASPARHKEWRGNLGTARRMIVANALARFSPAVAFGDALADRFSEIRENEMHVFPGTHDALCRLKGLGIRLALITNGPSDVQREKLERFDLAKYFDHIQIEGELGIGKPDERAYFHAIKALSVSADAVWMVGDNLEWEVAAPQRLGIFSVWLDAHGVGLPSNSSVQPNHVVSSLLELAELVDAAQAKYSSRSYR